MVSSAEQPAKHLNRTVGRADCLRNPSHGLADRTLENAVRRLIADARKHNKKLRPRSAPLALLRRIAILGHGGSPLAMPFRAPAMSFVFGLCSSVSLPSDSKNDP
jgi:hypothetical protein